MRKLKAFLTSFGDENWLRLPLGHISFHSGGGDDVSKEEGLDLKELFLV